MKKLLWILVAVALVGWILYSNIQQQKVTTDKKMVYAVLPLTGVVSEIGNEIKKTIELWEKEHPNATFYVSFVDNESKVDKAVSAVNQKLLTKNLGLYIVPLSFISKAVVPIIEKENGFTFVPVAVMSLGKDIKNYQRICSSISDSLNPLIKYIKPNISVGIINLDDEYGTLNANYFAENIKEKGAKITVQETIGLRDLDVKIPVYKVYKSNPDVIYLTGTATMAYSNILKELENLQYKGIVLVDYAFENRNNLNKIQGIKLNILVSKIPMDKLYQNNSNLVQVLQKSGLDVYYLPIQIWDTLDLIQYTLDNNLTFTQDTYTKMGKWQGVSGDVVFPGKGDSLYPFVLVKYQNGEFIPFESETK